MARPPSPREEDGRWVAKKGRELRVGNPILRRSRYFDVSRHGSRSPRFFLKPAKCQSFQMIPRNECPTDTAPSSFCFSTIIVEETKVSLILVIVK